MSITPHTVGLATSASWRPGRRVGAPAAGGARRLVGLVTGLGFLVYLIPLGDSVRAAPSHYPVDRARGIPLVRYLEADHDLNTPRSGVPSRLVPPVRLATGPVPDPGGPHELVSAGAPPDRPGRPGLRSDAPRSPPAS